ASLSTLLSPVAIISQIKEISRTKDLLNLIHPSIGLPILIGASVCLYLWLNKKIQKAFFPLMTSLLILFFIIFFIIWAPIDVWQWLPSYSGLLQYPWRLLGHISWIGAIFFAWVIYWVYQNEENNIPVWTIVLIIVGTSISWLSTPENTFIPVKDLKNNEYQVFNADTYLLNVNKIGTNKIDNLSLHFPAGFLKINQKFFLPNAFIQSAYLLKMQIGGIAANDTELFFVSNDKIIANKKVNGGAFLWEFIIPKIPNIVNTRRITFEVISRNKQANSSTKMYIMTLTGFLNPNKTVFLNQLSSHTCLQKSNITFCSLMIPKDIELLELPVFYYPEMLNITLNGKPIAYESIRHGSYLIVGIQPNPSTLNNIQIQFRGLLWANFICMGGWLLFLFFIVFLILRKISNIRIKP
ncbi:MAG: hypothetical protein JO131_03960, partial [Gammaproteobacteria bacterium]|nr:hypothetical protein [Gammaproteobacteria bacterium]